MRTTNKSTAYGYYGGVTQQNHYTPPKCDDFVPQSPKIYFTERDRQMLLDAAASLEFVQNNAQNILLRTNISEEPGNIDTFVISTSSKPEDVIKYTSSQDEVILDDIAGTGILNNPDAPPIDGGFF